MKKITKILSFLLVTVMVVSLLAAGVSAAEELTPIKKDDTMQGIPNDAGNITWLSDLYSTDAMKYSFVIGKNSSTTDIRPFACDQNFFGTRVYVYTDGSEYRKITSDVADADGNRTLSNGVTYNIKDIALGPWGTKYEKGLSFQPSPTGSEYPCTVVFDVTSLDVDTFYAVAGITGNANVIDNQDILLTFELHGSKDTAYSENSSFELLASVSNIRAYLTGEFNINIEGYNFIKLVCISTGKNANVGESTWANACVYKAGAGTGVENPGTNSGSSSSEDATPTDNYTASADGSYAGIPSEYLTSATYLSRMTYIASSNTTNEEYPEGKPTCINYPYNAPEEVITIGAQNTMFYKGLGMHPKNPSQPVDGSIESWTTYDISAKDADRFYAAVGITNAAGKEGAGTGVIFRVYGDYEGNGEFTLLAQSELITKTMTGEFDVDITGVKVLKLAVVAGGNSHASSACAFGDAAIYSTAATPETEPETQPDTKAPADTDGDSTGDNAQEPSSPVGLIIGIVVAVLVVAGVVVFIIIKKKKNA